MASTTERAVTSTLQTSGIGAAYRSVYDAVFEPNVYNKWIYKYGPGLLFKHFLDMVSPDGFTRDRSLLLFEEGALEKPITLGSAIAAGSAGDAISITLDSGDYQGSNPLLRVGDSVVIPAAYQPAAVGEPRTYLVTAKTGTAPNITFTAEPFNADGTTYTASQIAVEIPIGTKLQIGGTSLPRGSSPVKGKVTAPTSRTFYTNISREAFEMEGGLGAFSTYEHLSENGTASLFIRGQEEAEIRLDMQMDQKLWQSEENDNTALIASAMDDQSGSNAVESGVGYRNWLKRLASHISYDAPFDFSDFDRIKDLMISQGVTQDMVMMCVEPSLGTDLDNAGLDNMKQYSGGSDIFKGMNLGVEFGSFTKVGRTFLLKELQGLANPQTYGNSGYTGEGFIYPYTSARVTDYSGKNTDVPMLSLLYLGGKGTNRKRVVTFNGGTTGSNLGNVTQRTDIDYLDFLTEYMLVAVNVNQHIHITKA